MHAIACTALLFTITNMVKSHSFEVAAGFRLPITGWLPGETLFSLYARFHRLYGHMLSSATCRTLVGHAWQGSQHDLPGRIGEFVVRSEGHFGETSEQLARQHTLIGFYLPWRSVSQQQKAIQSMTNGGIGALKMHLGLPASRLRANHPLKFCPSCFTRDRKDHGVAYWHLAHQYPGVWTCIEHGCGLLESNVKATGVGRFLWHLPTLKDAYPMFEGVRPSQEALEVIRALSQLVCRASTLPATICIDYHRLHLVYRHKLRSRGLISDADRLVLRQICDEYQTRTIHFYCVSELRSLHQSPSAVQTQMRRFLSGPRPRTHPLRHLVFILAFFGDWNAFWDAYRDIKGTAMHLRARTDRSPIPATVPRRNASKREKFIQLMEGQGYSATKAADATGVDRHTGIAWATAQGLMTATRGQRSIAVRKRMIKELERGASLAQVSDKFEVSGQVVTRLLRSVVGLHQAWRGARHEIFRKRARALWQSARRRKPKCGATAIRALEPAAYAWLYRNDRHWLDAHKQSLKPAVRRKHRQVDWDARDEKFANAVRAAIHALSEDLPGRRITTLAILQKIPSLKAKLWAIDLLPRTKRLLESAQPIRKRKPTAQPNQNNLQLD